ncbi:MAG: carbonic anhydrase family protein [Treponema sp.]|jgi:carbonic anhydrase|nr:carbonic anhydrase family protein [Treponema sp.]
MMKLNMGYRSRKKRFLGILAGTVVLAVFLCTCTAGPARTSTAVETESHEVLHWSYEGDTGPEHWYALDPAYALARDGKAQSPIAIDSGDVSLNPDLAKPVISYRKTRFEIENNGHTIEALPAGDNAITLDGESYALQQFHFHSPSEHTIDGVSFAMELHLVHKNDQGNLVVIGLMISQGAANETLQGIFENLPAEITREESPRPEVELDLSELFAAEAGVYRYEGSLTTPPCTEGVKWNLVIAPIELSPEQIQAFKALYTGNNRPLQNRYERPVYAVTEQEVGT